MKVGKTFGLCLARSREFITQDGRFAVEMELAGAKWIDNNSGRLLMTGKPPREAVTAICKLAQSVPEWEVGSPSDLTFRAKRQVAALKGVGQLRPADLKALGLTQSPSNDALKTLIAAAARLLTSGALATPAGKRDQAILVAAAQGANPAVAQAIAGAGQPGQNNGVNPSQAAIESEIRRLAQGANIPARSLIALVATESSFQQFDSTGMPLKNVTSTAIGLTQILRGTASLFGADYNRLGRDWAYNLEIGSVIFADGYRHPWNANIPDARIHSARAYGMYHDGISGKTRFLYDPKVNAGLTGTSYESAYLGHYDSLSP